MKNKNKNKFIFCGVLLFLHFISLCVDVGCDSRLTRRDGHQTEELPPWVRREMERELVRCPRLELLQASDAST